MYDLSLHQVNRNAIAVRSIQKGFEFGELSRSLKTSCDAHRDWANSGFPLLLSIVHRWLLRFGTFIKNPLKNRKIANTSKKPFQNVVSPFTQIGIYLAIEGVGKMLHDLMEVTLEVRWKIFFQQRRPGKGCTHSGSRNWAGRRAFVLKIVIIFSWNFFGHIR